jgi:hypothetical protein
VLPSRLEVGEPIKSRFVVVLDVALIVLREVRAGRHEGPEQFSLEVLEARKKFLNRVHDPLHDDMVGVGEKQFMSNNKGIRSVNGGGRNRVW